MSTWGGPGLTNPRCPLCGKLGSDPGHRRHTIVDRFLWMWGAYPRTRPILAMFVVCLVLVAVVAVLAVRLALDW